MDDDVFYCLMSAVPPRMPIDKPGMSIISPSVVHLTWKSARVSPKTSDLSPTTYRVEVRVDETFNWVEHVSGATDLYADIENLNIVFDYAFRVRAVNDFGWSKTTLPVYLHRPKGMKLCFIALLFLLLLIVALIFCCCFIFQ